jgi:hypothetical protein
MNKWDDEGENSLWLLTPEELGKLPDGIILECIDGTKVTKGKDYIDDDTRGGYIAFGIRKPFKSEYKIYF